MITRVSESENNDIMFSSVGTLRVAPKLERLETNTDNWLIIEVDPGIGDYYRNWFNGNFSNKAQGLKLMKPAWGSAHISVVRNEEPKNKEL